jgi:pimeloyl-ACP methyl ester carboxylesterase
MAAAILLQAAGQLAQPPKGLVLVAGMVPAHQDHMLNLLPRRTRNALLARAALGRLSRRPLALPQKFIRRSLCNGLTPQEVTQIVGRFGPLPVKVLKTPLAVAGIKLPCPVTCLVLTQDRLVPPALQRRMAGRVPGAETVELDSCHQALQHRPSELAQLLIRHS